MFCACFKQNVIPQQMRQSHILKINAIFNIHKVYLYVDKKLLGKCVCVFFKIIIGLHKSLKRTRLGILNTELRSTWIKNLAHSWNYQALKNTNNWKGAVSKHSTRIPSTDHNTYWLVVASQSRQIGKVTCEENYPNRIISD